MIDWTRVEELKDEIGAEDFAEVVEIFLEEVEEVIERLSSPARAGDVSADLHFLKGSALNLGFQAVSDLCQQAEAAAASGASEEEYTGQILSTYAASKDMFLNESLQRQSA